MSLHDFIDEGFSIVYHDEEREKQIWDQKEKLKEEFPLPGRELVGAKGYTKFHKRMVDHFSEGKLVEYREIMYWSLEMYGYKKPVSTRLMRFLWLSGKVRRFFKFREGKKANQARGVHYVFLPRSLWKKRDMWEPIMIDGSEPSEQPK